MREIRNVRKRRSSDFFWNRIAWAIWWIGLGLFLIFHCGGCAYLNTNSVESYGKTSSLYQPPSLEERAGFYASNYPDSTLNEKATMLKESLERTGDKITVVEKEYVVKVMQIYDDRGHKIWPVYEVKDLNGMTDFDHLGETLQALDSSFKKDKSDNVQIEKSE
jgi:hypothetical protein